MKIKAIFFVILFLLLNQGHVFAANLSLNNQTKCVQIYYDHARDQHDPKYYRGRLYAIALQNLLGHFPHIQQYIIPIELYKKGQLERCEASFYLASYYNNDIPQDFLHDFVATKKNVAWVGFNIWKLPVESVKKIWSATFAGNAITDWKVKDSQGRPGVYQYYDYKGETFERCQYPYHSDSPLFAAHYNNDFKIGLMTLTDKAAEKNVVSYAHLNVGKKKTPFILRKENHWLVAENPFLFICEGDRYFIFADVLFDILNEPSQDGGKKFAFVRYEDVSARQAPTKMTTLIDMFDKLKTPFAISLIPIYVDSLHVYKDPPYMEMQDKPIFIQALNYAKDHGASFIMHGVSHQYDTRKDPFSGVTAEDFEFWDQVNHRPIAEDSVKYVLDRLTKGATLIRQAGFNISAWMTAHYSASPLDNTIFGEVFTWNVTRGNYAVSNVCHFTSLPEQLTLDKGEINNETNDKRFKILEKLSVTAMSHDGLEINQIFPYSIYGDYYGRRVIPEDLGNVQPFVNHMVIHTRSVDQILKDAKRYKVLRDVWASFFIHDLLLNLKQVNGLAKTPGDTSELERLIKGIQALGYEFINLEAWTATHSSISKRKVPIEDFANSVASICR